MRRSPVVIAVFALLVALSACGDPGPAAVTLATLAPALAAPHHAAITVEYCVDNTGSYSPIYFQQADQYVADSLIGSVALNSDPITLYPTLINSQTGSTATTLQPIVIPPLPAPPAPPTLTPTPDPHSINNPLNVGKAQGQTVAADNDLIATYNAQLQQVLQQEEQAVQAVSAAVQPLIAMRQQADDMTSVWGCVLDASVRLSGKAGAKYLIIASDMQNNSCVDCGAQITLSQVHVHVIFFEHGPGDAAQQLQRYWAAQFQQARAAGPVPFDDPSVSLGQAQRLQQQLVPLRQQLAQFAKQPPRLPELLQFHQVLQQTRPLTLFGGA